MLLYNMIYKYMVVIAWYLDLQLQLHVQSVPIDPFHGEVYSIQYYGRRLHKLVNGRRLHKLVKLVSYPFC